MDDGRKVDAEVRRQHEVGRIARILIVVMAIAAACIWLVGLGGYFGVIGVLILIGTAASTVGAALGFIFAIPRAKDRAELAVVAAQAESAEGDRTSRFAQSKAFLQTNSNLVRISDWLTTMLVGVGLTQLNQLHQTLRMFGLYLKEAYGVCGTKGCPADVLSAIGPGVLVFGAFAGFLFMYLYTRLVLVQLLNNIEQDLEGVEDDQTAVTETAANSLREALGESKIDPGDASNREAKNVGDALKLMFAALYKDSPDGFTEVLKIAAALSRSNAVNHAEYWFYQAAAFGQQHAYLQKHGGGDLQSARDNALDCAWRAVELKPGMRSRLKALTRPTGEDDLYSLKDDPAFVNLFRQA